MRVLLVDDDTESALPMQTLFEMEGFTVTTAFTADDALRRASSFAPEVALLDLGLPESNGFELCRQLRCQNPSIRLVVALTGYGGAKVEEDCRQAGFDAHLLKPCAINDVIAALHQNSGTAVA